jgi:hypothetical protein
MKMIHQSKRHIKAACVAFMLVLLLWTIHYWHTYMGPSAIAKADDGRFLIGSGVVLVITTVVLALIFLPAIVFGAVSRHLLSLSRWVELPMTLICGSGFSLAISIWYAKAITTSPTPTVVESLKGFGIYLALPLTFYWYFTRIWKQNGEQDAPSNGG